MTVSRVVNRRGSVRRSTVDKVEKAISKVGYQPNIDARRLSGARTWQLLMIFNNPNVAWIAELLVGVMNACRDLRYHVLIEGVGGYGGGRSETPVDYDALERLIDRSRVDGVILSPPICFDRRLLEIVTRQGVPCVRIGGGPGEAVGLRVGIDNLGGAHDMANHLVSLGHENLAIVRGPEEFAASELRLEGFELALREHGLDLPATNVRQGDFDAESGYRCARELLRIKNRPTAIFASNDEMAAGVLAAAGESGIRVPEQLSVAGFDDAPIAKSIWPRLTTVRQPLRAMGEQSVELLERYIRQVEGESSDEVQSSILLDYELRIRGSTGPCAAAGC